MARRNRRADRRAARLERKSSRRSDRQGRKDSRRTARLDRQANRQDQRSGRQANRQASKQAAYAAGVDPNSWVGSLGSTVASVAESRSDRKQAEAMADAWDGTGQMPTAMGMNRRDLSSAGGNNTMLIAGVALAAFLLMKKK